MSLRGVIEESANGLPDIELTKGQDSSLVWSRAGHPFATLSADGSAAEFSLDLAVAAAAARTPDVSSSARGSGWVRFSPNVLDDHGVDRAVAWFGSAYRRVAGG